MRMTVDGGVTYARVNGLNMYYETHGSGRAQSYPLVLIHGGGSTIESTFGRIMPELAQTRQVIAVELQAHGHTKDIDRPLTFEQDADDSPRCCGNSKPGRRMLWDSAMEE